MRNLYVNNQGRAIPGTLRAYFPALLALMLVLTVATQTFGQCTGGTCNFTISNNTSATIPAGQTYCLQKNNYSGTITFGAGSTLCIGAGITWNGTGLNFSGATGTINNYGTSNKNFTLPNGYTFNNYNSYTGTLTTSSGSTFDNESTGTYSGTINGNAGSTITNDGVMTISGGAIAGTFNSTSGSTTTNNVTMSGTNNLNGTFNNNVNGNVTGSTTITGTFNNSGSMNGTVIISAGGTMNNSSNNVSGSTNFTVNGTLANNANQLNGTIAVNSGGALTNVSGGLIQSGTVTVSAGGTVSNSGTISDNTSVSGTLTNSGTMSGTLSIAASGSVTNNGTISGPLNTIAGTLINNSGATVQNAIVESAGASITNSGTMNNGVTVNGGTFNNTSTGNVTGGSGLVITGGTVTNSGSTLAVNINGGTLTNNSTITNLTISGSAVLNNNGTLNGSINISGGTITNNSGATINPTSFNTAAGAGSLTNNGTMTLPSGTTTIFSGYTVTNNGTMSSGPITVNAGGTLTLGSAGTEAINGNVVNNGTINLAGSLSLGAHTYSGSGTMNETSAGCNTFTVSSNTSTGSFNGGQSTYGGGLIVNSTSGGATMTNGASATITTPVQQPTGFGSTISALTVSAGFTSPSAGITGYIVLRYIGLSAPSDNPVNNTLYTVGSTIGSSTVVAMVAGGSVGVKTFTDNLPSSACGQNAYYRIFSYNGGGACNAFDLTAPLTGTQAVTIPTATITPSGATTFCTGGSVTLTAAGGSSYLWSNAASTAAITVNATNNYTVTVTNTTGCTATASQPVIVNTVPAAVTVSGAGTFCTSAVLTASGGAGGTIYWENTTSNGTSTLTPSASQTVTTSGTYYFRANNACGWSTQGSAAVTINNGPAVAPITGTTTVCAGSTTLLTDATILGTTSWSSSNTSVATVALGLVTGVSAGTTTISYTVTPLLGGCSTTVTTTVTVTDVPSATIVTGGTTQCGGIVTLSATGGTNGTIYWENTTSNGTSTATPSVSQTVAASGTYYFRANNSCGWGAQGSQVVTINAYPVVAAITGTTTVCAGSTTTLSDATASGVWSSSNTAVATISAGGVVTGVAAGTATISYTVTSAAGCVTTVTTTVTVNAVPVVAAITGTNTVCVGLTTTYSDATASGVWSSSNTAVATVNASGVVTGVSGGVATISYAVTNAAGCITTVTRGVTVNALPTPTVNNAVSCSGATVTLTATGGVSYVWSTGATTNTITTAVTGTYTVTATNASGCTATASGTVTAVANPTPSVTNPAVCAPNSAIITATGGGVGGSYVWSNGITSASDTTAIAGVYHVTVTNSSGCSAIGSGIVTINALPVPVVPNDTVCAGSIATLTATGGVAYVWSTGSHAASITTTVAGTYTVTATSIGGCTASTTGQVVLSANPVVTTTGGVICSGVPVTLTASGATSYAWSNGLITPSITVSAANTYSVTGSNSYGCTASASTTVAASTYPTPVGHRDSVCIGSAVTLTANNGATYLWSTGATTASVSVSPVSTTTYTFTATNAAGCSASAIDTVTVNALPVASATNGVICTGGTTTPATLTASGGTSYHWSNGALTQSITTVSLVPPTYTVTVTNVSGCTASATASVSTAVKPAPTVNSPSVCSGTSTVLTATTVGGATYVWSTAATTASITVAPLVNTTYTVTATNASGCTASVSSLVTDYPKPTVTVSSNSPVLLNATINLTSTVTGGTAAYGYSWSGPAAFSSAAANPTVTLAQPTNGGIYTVTVSDAHACTATANTTVILNFTSPGGITSNDALWLNANVGVATSGSNLTAWNDQSGLGNNATTVNGTAPTLVAGSINSYPAVNFAGAGGMQGAFGTTITSAATSSFVVTKAINNSNNGIFSMANTTGNTQDNNNAASAIMFMTGANSVLSYRNNANRGSYTNANALGNYHMFTSIFSSTSANDFFYTEGAAATNVATPSASLSSNIYTIGSRIGPSRLYLNGQIAEVILFNIQLSAAQKNQVESYLATKYGFTLDQTTATNYVGSNGVTFWNAASNGVYKNNIFGVGIDNVSTLNQTASVSINTNKLSIANATGLTYYSFLMVADNAGANTVTAQTGLPNNINAAISTVWRASQTGSRATADFSFHSASTNFGYYAPISSSMTVYMLIDSNADGIYETYLAPSSTSALDTVNTFNANLKDGALFTFGFKASIDFGDAPTVPTLMANNGAGHMIVPGVYLGNLIDGELDGQPSVNSVGDDTIGVADEDGVNFNIGVPTTNNIVTMGLNTITVKASVAGYLNAWADFNQDGTYGGGSEYAIQNFHLVAGNNTVTFNVSDSVEYGPTSMRFRFAQNLGDVTAPTGLATNGEVEDYKIYVTAPLVGACTNGFQNPGFEMGPNPAPNNYIITSETNLPYWRTTAPDKMIESWYNGFNGVPSHGGTYFMELEANLYGALYQDVYTTPGTKLTWSFAHRGRSGNDTAQLRIGAPGATTFQATAIDGNTAWGVYNGTYIVPAGQYITRLEFWAVGSYGGNTSIGNFLDDVSVVSSFDYGDAPNSYGTLLANNGPYHAISTNLYLGTGVTCDVDGQPSATASLDGLDDGITFPAPCSNCNTYTVSISVYNNSGLPATIAGWIDFNKNGVFDANERQSVTVPTSASQQTVSMTFTITTFSATTPGTFARFRIANDSTEIATPYGYANSGEVEDYPINCLGLPIPVPTATTPACARGTLYLTASGTAPFYTWTGPNGYTSNVQNPTRNPVPAADSGYYRVYAIYANGCERDSAVKVAIASCTVSINGSIFDDANGNGILDGTDATSSQGKTIYAVLADNTNTVLATTLIAANGTFTFTAPAYMSGLTIVPSTTNPSVGSASGGPLWPSRWVGTKEQYGINNQAGTGSYAIPNLVPVNTAVANITGLMLGYDRLPTSVIQNYTIPYPDINTQRSLIPANGLGILAGSDSEDGAFTSGSTFTITSLAGMNGNTLYYDANGDGTLQSYEQITGYTTITNFDPTKLIIHFVGVGSMSAQFVYGSTDAASKVDPTPATYTINWIGTLPVKMLYFTAQKQGETESLLKWATATEIDNDHFEIERSADGQNWEKIGEQKGAGSTSLEQDYTFTDAQPLSGVNYYRLKQVDVDGKFSYTDIAEVTFGTIAAATQSESTLSVYPNPLNQSSKLNINLASATENISEVTITNSVGQVVYSTNLPQIQNYQVFGLNLPSGVYIVSVRTQQDTQHSTRLVITK